MWEMLTQVLKHGGRQEPNTTHLPNVQQCNDVNSQPKHGFKARHKKRIRVQMGKKKKTRCNTSNHVLHHQMCCKQKSNANISDANQETAWKQNKNQPINKNCQSLQWQGSKPAGGALSWTVQKGHTGRRRKCVLIGTFSLLLETLVSRPRRTRCLSIDLLCKERPLQNRSTWCASVLHHYSWVRVFFVVFMSCSMFFSV